MKHGKYWFFLCCPTNTLRLWLHVWYITCYIYGIYIANASRVETAQTGRTGASTTSTYPWAYILKYTFIHTHVLHCDFKGGAICLSYFDNTALNSTELWDERFQNKINLPVCTPFTVKAHLSDPIPMRKSTHVSGRWHFAPSLESDRRNHGG